MRTEYAIKAIISCLSPTLRSASSPVRLKYRVERRAARCVRVYVPTSNGGRGRRESRCLNTTENYSVECVRGETKARKAMNNAIEDVKTINRASSFETTLRLADLLCL